MGQAPISDYSISAPGPDRSVCKNTNDLPVRVGRPGDNPPLRTRNRAYREVCSVGEVRAQKARWCLGVQTWSLFRSIPLVGGNGCVREQQSPPLAVTYHSLDRIEQVTSRRIWITESARYLKVVPGNPKRIFNQY